MDKWTNEFQFSKLSLILTDSAFLVFSPSPGPSPRWKSGYWEHMWPSGTGGWDADKRSPHSPPSPCASSWMCIGLGPHEIWLFKPTTPPWAFHWLPLLTVYSRYNSHIILFQSGQARGPSSLLAPPQLSSTLQGP